MMELQIFSLSNGLKVILWPWLKSEKVVFNFLIRVGAKDEEPHQTGLAHLFEHLMFAGSQHLPMPYDEAIEKVGGNSNAFTTPDITCYETEVPASVLEYLLWVESDRFFYLDLSDKAIEIQKKVVTEEFYEGYLNTPYGDAYHHLLELAFPNSPYQWPTIGKTPEHIESVTPQIVREFYQHYYQPAHATLILSGKLPANVEQLISKWYDESPSYPSYPNRKPYSYQEPYSSVRRKEHFGEVPFPRLYRAYLIPGAKSLDILPFQLLQLLTSGVSGYLYSHFVVQENVCTSISSTIYGLHEQGLWIIIAQTETQDQLFKLSSLLDQFMEPLVHNLVTEYDLEYAQNQFLSGIYQTRNHLSSGTTDIVYMDSLGLLDYWGKEEEILFSISKQKFVETVSPYLLENPYAELWYLPSLGK